MTQRVEPLLFLDLDGVLNDHEWDEEVMCGQIHQDKVDRLNTILRSTGAKIVLSSAWRYLYYRGEMNLMGLEWLLRSHGILANRLIDITEKDAENIQQINWDGTSVWVPTNERGQQITNWLNTNPKYKKRYVVIDDLDLGISQHNHPFVQTDGKVGLTDKEMLQVIALLNGDVIGYYGGCL